MRTLGDDHRDTRNAKVNFAGTLMGLGKVEEALPLMKDMTDTRRAELGPDHIETTCITSVHGQPSSAVLHFNVPHASP